MFAVHEQYIIDEAGKKKSVVISVREWEKIREILEEYDDIRAYDEAKSKSSEMVPFKQAIKQLKK